MPSLDLNQNMFEREVPLSDLDYGTLEEDAVLRVLRSKWLSMGPEVEAFESEFSAFMGAENAIAVANGTGALQLAYLALGVGPGDEVIQPAINFVASANMALAVGAVPVFADLVGLGEPTIDPAEVESLVTPRTRAVVVMHYAGHACRLDPVVKLCRDRGIALIEDACHALGARYHASDVIPGSPMLGAIGDAGCFSFFGNKNLAVGEGGMVVTNDGAVAAAVRQLRSHGMTSVTWDRHRGYASTYDVVTHGYNYRLDEIRAALGRVQLSKLAANNHRRGLLVDIYIRELRDIPGWIVPFVDDEGESAHHLMVVVAPDRDIRQRVVDVLDANGVQTSAHYPCIPDFQAFERWRSADVGIAREYAARVITLPLYPTLGEEEVRGICDLIRKHAG